jgi:NADH:ubiquinone oxidoreductase subunit E
MSNDPLASITICMGSSCFLRGNNRNIEVIQNFIASHSLARRVELAGHLCEGHCKAGPNVTINDKMYHEVDPIGIVGLMNHHFMPPSQSHPKGGPA